MPSFKKLIDKNQCIINVIVKESLGKNIISNDSLSLKNLYNYSFKALIDTGAQNTCITNEVVKKLNLSASGKSNINSASHSTVPVNNYRVDLFIPIGEISPIIQGG